jgi:NADH-quinone oxidoreductase subunit A
LYQDFTPIIIFVVLTVALIAAPLIIQYLITPRFNKGGDKLVSFECGELPEHNAWVKFNIRFYIIALVFLIFDVEVIFLYPWAVVFQDLGLLAFIEMFIFILILIAGFAYVWVKGDLDWVKMTLKYGSGRYSNLKNTGEGQ